MSLSHRSPPWPPRYRTFSEILPSRAADTPDREAYSFLHDGDVKSAERMTFGALDARARRLAAELVKVAPDERACVLFLPPGLDFVAALFACFYANKVVVTLPVLPGRVLPHIQRELLAIISKSRARVIIANHSVKELADAVGLRSGASAGSFVFVDAADDPSRTPLKRPLEADESAMAVMQFTSGTTSSPKGVMVSHRAALHNLAALEARYGYGPDCNAVMWTPHYHDMGLILGIMNPSYSGFPVALMSPVDFIRTPARWLEAIDVLRATGTWAPNFAFELCSRQPPAKVDLSSLRVAGCGAEPIAAATLQRFTERFASSGFDPRALSPSYGLAESVVGVAGGQVGRGPVYLDLASAAVRPTDFAGTERLVSSGRPFDGTEVRIVAPAEREPVPDGTTGEIWVRGPSVTLGYWEELEETREIFGATLANGDGPFLRTGDLGFLLDGELYLTGRRKESIIRNGLKYAPADLERAAESRPSVRGGRTAAFAVTRPGGADQIVLLAEARDPAVDGEAELAAIVETVFTTCGLQLDQAHFVAPGTILKTSSGKHMRVDCRRRYLAGEIESVHSYRRRGLAQ